MNMTNEILFIPFTACASFGHRKPEHSKRGTKSAQNLGVRTDYFAVTAGPLGCLCVAAASSACLAFQSFRRSD